MKRKGNYEGIGTDKKRKIAYLLEYKLSVCTIHGVDWDPWLEVWAQVDLQQTKRNKRK